MEEDASMQESLPSLSLEEDVTATQERYLSFQFSERVQSAVLRALRTVILMSAAINAPDVSAEPPEPIQIKQHEKQTSAEWEHQMLITFEKEMRILTRKLDSPKFAERSEATRDICNAFQELGMLMHPLPPEFNAALEQLEERLDQKELSLEQFHRLKSAARQVEQLNERANDRIPPREYKMTECISMIEKQTGFNIQIDPYLAALMQDQSITVEHSENDCYGVLLTLAEELGAYVAPTDESSTLQLSIDKNKEKHRYMTGAKAIGFIKKDSENKERDVLVVRQSPRSGGLVSFDEEKKSFGSMHAAELPNETNIKWQITSGGHETIRKHTLEKTSDPHACTLRGCAVFHPKTFTIFCDKATEQTGYQRIMLAKPDADDPTKVEITSFVFGDVAWPDTSHAQDTKTYAAAAANRYVMFDEKGELVPATLESITVNQRTMTMTYRAAKPVTSAEVTTFTGFQEHAEITLVERQDNQEGKE